MSNKLALLVTPSQPASIDTGSTVNYLGVIDLGGELTISGAGTDVVTEALLSSGGFISVENGATFDVTGGAVDSGTFFTIGSGGTLIEGGNEFNFLSPVDFTGPGKLELNTQGGFQPRPLSPILGFSAGDTIEVNTAINGTSYNAATGVLTLMENGVSVGSLTVEGNGLSAGFHITPDGSSGYDITVACFLPGTHVLTARGEVAAGDVEIGDRLITLSGAAKPVKWIGRRSYSASVVASDPQVAPVLVRQGALADCLPTRDLYLSPCHALYVDGVLIEAGHLVNGVSVVRVDAEAAVDYVNFELEDHEVIFVEGVAAETGAGPGNRAAYDNALEYARLYPDEVQGQLKPDCAARLDCGFEVEAVRARIDARAGMAPRGTGVSGELKGWIAHVDAGGIRGVAYNLKSPAPVVIEVLVDGDVVGEAIANHDRTLLVGGEHIDRRCGFSVKLPDGLSPYRRHVISVRRAADGAELFGSPYMMEAAIPLTEMGRHKLSAALGDAVAQAGSVADMDRVLSFLAAKAEILLQAKADLAGNRAERSALRPAPGRSDLRAPAERQAA